MKVSGLPIGMQIGFANEYYTLWRVDEPNEYGVQDAYFCGNISKDKNMAQEKYPNLAFTGLQGYSFVWEPKTKDDGTSPVFVFGRYEGKTFDTAPTNYVSWYWGETRNTSALQYLLENGFVLQDGVLYASQNEAKEALEIKEVTNMLTMDGEHEVTIVSNISLGEEEMWLKVRIENDTHFSLFPYGQDIRLALEETQISVRSYRGYDYGVLCGMKSMKGMTAQIKVLDGAIVAIN